MIERQVHLNAFAYLSEYGQSDCGFSHVDTLRCGNIVLLTEGFLDVAKFTNLNPLSLLIPCKLAFPIVGLKMSSQPTLALKSLSRIFV
jgi:hypothetical protein